MDAFPIHQSLSSFLLIVLLFFTPASSDQEYEQRFLNCLRMPTTFDCGGAQFPIYFPFWTENSPENCRFPYENEIKCNRTDNSSEIVVQKRPYHVIEIDYEAQKATIVDKDYYFAAKKDMSPRLAPSSNTSLDFNLFNYTHGDLNLSFLNCPDHLAPNDIYFKFPTSWFSYDLRDHAYYFTFEEHITGPFINCQVIQIPILLANKDRLWENPEEFWIDVLAGGFEVTWSLTRFDPHCWDCFESYGHCRFNKTSPLQRDCNCNKKSLPPMCPLAPPPAMAPAPAPAPGNGKRKKYIMLIGTMLFKLFLSFGCCHDDICP